LSVTDSTYYINKGILFQRSFDAHHINEDICLTAERAAFIIRNPHFFLWAFEIMKYSQN
jgi:hypothetical protein